MTRPNHIIRHATGRALLRSAAVLLVALLAFGDLVHAGAITRDTVVQRSKRWVDLGVSYSQSSWFEGYRQDCSGFVSMSWQLTDASGRPISPATDALPGHAVPITKDRLLPGDMIVRPKTATTWGHSVIFGGWADEEQITYWCYEQSNSAGGARLRQTPYPYWPSAGIPFAPYRYKAISDEPDYVTRVHGNDRFATAAAVSERSFPDTGTVSTVVLATGESWPDALGGAGLAGAVGGPVLLTHGSSLPERVRSELQRLAPARVLVLGGPAAVSDAVVEQVRESGIATVERIAGADRYRTAALIALRLAEELEASGREFDGTVYLATGEDFADALSVSPVSALRTRPVLLVQPDGVPDATAEALERLGATRAYVVGGQSAVSPAVLERLTHDGLTVTRVAGPDRYATALAVADHGVAEGLSRVGAGIAAGTSFADALAAGAALGQDLPPAVLYLTPASRVAPALHDELRIHRSEIATARVYGGPVAVSDRVVSEVAKVLRGP